MFDSVNKCGYTTIIDDGYQEHIRWICSLKTKDLVLKMFNDNLSNIFYKQLNQVLDCDLIENIVG